jgi:hypothetical protein
MKRIPLFIIAFLLIAGTAFALPGSPPSSGIATASNCDVAAYYAVGKLCQDTDDGKLYKGTGAAIVEIASGASGDVTAASVAQTWGNATDPVVWTFGVTGTDPTITATASTFTFGANLALGANNITSTGSLGATGAGKLTKIWSIDAEFTNYPSVNGASVFNQDVTSDANPSFGTLNLVSANALNLGTSSSAAGEVRFKNATNNNYFYLLGGVSGANIGWTFPTAVPAGENYLVRSSTTGVLSYVDPATIGGGGYTNLTSFIDQTAWRVFYSDGSGDVKELALGSDGTYLRSNGASSAPTFDTPSGAAHDALTLDTTTHVDDVFSLSTQRLDFDTQTANYVFAGPNTGAAAAPTFRALVSADIPANAAATSSSAASLSVSGQTGLMTVTGITSTNRAKTVRDAADTVLELGGSYTPTGTWNVGSMTFTSPPWQASDTELTALAGLTFADASIIQLTGAGTAAVLTSGGNNRLLGSNSDNTALEFKSTVSGITFGGFTASRNVESDGSGNLVVSDTATTGTGAPVKGTAPQISTIELGHASDTTLGRTSAGIANIEASNIILGTLGATTNVIPKASGTGTVTLAASGITEDGTNVSIGALNLVTTGNISGNVAVIDMGNTAATYAMGASDAYGKMFLQTHGDAATDVTLPDYQAAGASDHVKVGSTVCIMTLTAYATLIHPAADDKIRTSNGTLNAAGVGVTGPTTLGAFSCYMLTDSATDVGHWTQLGMSGAWAAH